MITRPTIDEVQAIDLSPLYDLAVDNPDNRRLLRGRAGVEHYKLLAWFSMLYDGILITEIGTLGGLGLIALSYNSKNHVISFDIRGHDWGNTTPVNAEKKIVYDGYMDEVVKSTIIFYDAAHEGKEEQEFLDELIKRGWKGILVLDDIRLNKEMAKFWANIKLPKEDWTDIGHSVGTGVVFLS